MTARSPSSPVTNLPAYAWPVMAVLLVLGWSSGFVGFRYVSGEASVAVTLFWRTLLAGLILLPFALSIGARPDRARLAAHACLGVMSMFIYLGGFVLAIEREVPVGLVALIADLLPLAIAVLSQPMLGERLLPRQWAGTAVAVSGVGLVSFDSLRLGEAPLWAYGLVVAAVLAFALASVLYRGRPLLQMPMHQSLCVQSFAGAVLFGAVALWQGDLAPPLTGRFAFGMSWLVLTSTLTYAIYYTGLRLFPATKVSAAIYLSPPVTMLWAWALFNEPLTMTMAAGLGVTLCGVWLTSANVSDSRSEAVDRAD